MNSDTGGLSSEERQRRTAASIARKKVLSAYGASSFSSQNQNNTQPANQPTKTYEQQEPVQAQTALDSSSNGAYKYSSIQMSPEMNEELKRYHSAWQSYYQKYYNDYYSKAAKDYIQNEHLKEERDKHDRLAAGALDPDATDNDKIADTLRSNIQKKANSRFKLKHSHKKLVPLFAGIFVALFILFLQYNRLIFAPIAAYISPSTTSDDGITAVDPTVAATVSDQNKLIIPKLNVDVPVHFGISNDTTSINKAMMEGVAHFMVPGANAFPGQIGNVVISGHSAGDIYSSNQYKFIFSGLERLVEGDLVYIDYNKIRYTYKVTGSRVVEPTDVNALVYNGDKAILTLITCVPLGTSKYRLLVTAEQIDPAIDASTTTQEVNTDEENSSDTSEMPNNERTFFQKVWSFVTGDVS